nr:RNA polymerase sigma factor [Gorillibacterium massiliense]
MDAPFWYEELKSDLYRFARSISRHEQEADDLVQDAWVKALKEEDFSGWPVYKQRAWFYRVMKNRMIDERRKEKRLTVWEEDTVNAAEPLVGDDPVDAAELLSHLPGELSNIVFKRYWLGLNSREIGKQLGIPDATVRYKLQQAMKQLRKIMEA